jgi:hypothetical protein
VNRPVVTLSGRAAERSQYLVADLLKEEVQLARPVSEEQDRDFGALVDAAAVGFVVNATYDVAKRIVHRWLQREEIDPEEVSLVETEDVERIADVDWDWPST